MRGSACGIAYPFETSREGLMCLPMTGIDLQDALIPADGVQVLAETLKIPADIVTKRNIPRFGGNGIFEVGDPFLLALEVFDFLRIPVRVLIPLQLPQTLG